MRDRDEKKVEKARIQQTINGYTLGTKDDVECSNCGKSLHEGEDVVVSVRKVGVRYVVELTNCGSCSSKGIESSEITAKGRLVTVSDHALQRHLLALFDVSDVEMLE